MLYAWPKLLPKPTFGIMLNAGWMAAAISPYKWLRALRQPLGLTSNIFKHTKIARE